MSFYVIVMTTVLTHIAFKGSKVLIALYAMELGANPFSVGMLFSLYSLFPLFLAVYAGRLSDRLGPRVPMLIGAGGLGCGLLLPYLLPGLPVLYASATLIGACYIFYTIAVQHLIGTLGAGHDRTRNFSTFSLGIGVTALFGPAVSGFSIDLIGHQSTYLLLASLPVGPVLFLLFFSGRLPRAAVAARQEERRTMDLVKNAPLRRALVTAGIVEAAFELFNFYMPVYGHSIGLSASLIGIVMGTFAIALLLMRAVMPMLVRKSSEERVLCGSLGLAAATCVLFPFVTDVYLLLAISFVLGLGLGCCPPLSMIITYNRAPAGRSGEAMGLRQTVNKFTEVMVPLIFGTLGAAFGLGPPFWMNALLLAAGAFLMQADARLRVRTRRATSG